MSDCADDGVVFSGAQLLQHCIVHLRIKGKMQRVQLSSSDQSVEKVARSVAATCGISPEDALVLQIERILFKARLGLSQGETAFYKTCIDSTEQQQAQTLSQEQEQVQGMPPLELEAMKVSHDNEEFEGTNEYASTSARKTAIDLETKRATTLPSSGHSMQSTPRSLKKQILQRRLATRRNTLESDPPANAATDVRQHTASSRKFDADGDDMFGEEEPSKALPAPRNGESNSHISDMTLEESKSDDEGETDFETENSTESSPHQGRQKPSLSLDDHQAAWLEATASPRRNNDPEVLWR